MSYQKFKTFFNRQRHNERMKHQHSLSHHSWCPLLKNSNFIMARMKQTAKNSMDSKAPLKHLATKAARAAVPSQGGSKSHINTIQAQLL
jgi:hypothetical protein